MLYFPLNLWEKSVGHIHDCTLSDSDYDDGSDSYPGHPNSLSVPVPCHPGPGGEGTAWPNVSHLTPRDRISALSMVVGLSPLGAPSNMSYARLHHIGPYAENFAMDYTEDYPNGEPGIAGRTTGVTRAQVLPWVQGLTYLGTVSLGAVLGYTVTTSDRQPTSRHGRRRKRILELKGTIVGIIAGTLVGIALDAWVLPYIPITGTED